MNDSSSSIEDDFDREMKQYLSSNQQQNSQLSDGILEDESSIMQQPKVQAKENRPSSLNVQKVQEKSQLSKFIHHSNKLYSCEELKQLQKKKIAQKPNWNSYFVNNKKRTGQYGFGNNQKIKEALKKKSEVVGYQCSIVSRCQNWEIKKARNLLQKSRQKYKRQASMHGLKPRILRY